ncbi:MAG: coenzyme F420 hydrogenase/dehydrogenase beta subunit N-terminal domain-containing protein, partial [Acidimicrobiales bacterium]|nr:coenzyme F420 hydrogenase/dehydrogenase beta subunit N-terminal domain-containing protein [Acidimicrobiales bacterium]
MSTTEAAPPKAERWTAQWKHLFDEVVVAGTCTGCSGCVVACPHDVLGYNDEGGVYKPFHLEEELGPDNCIHGEKGCTSCTRACPRFRAWETEIDTFMFDRPREQAELYGISKDIILARASDDMIHQMGQDGGVVSAMLIWCLEKGYIDAALVSYLEGDGSTWKALPGVARTKEDVLAAAGSRYTYSATPMGYA